jgi:xanthine dehydrogenase accessory factor
VDLAYEYRWKFLCMAENVKVLKKAIEWLSNGKGVSLAVVVGTWGSSPRPAGSLLAVAEGGEFVGSVSGGCVEGAVVEHGLGIIRGGPNQLLDFGISDEKAWEVGLACGGEMKVFVGASPPIEELVLMLKERPIAMVTDLNSGARVLVSSNSVEGSLSLTSAETVIARQALRENRGQMMAGERRLFVAVYNLPLRIVIVGAVHVAQTLAPMAVLAGFDVMVIDPRHSFATEARFPGLALLNDWPDDAMAKIGLNSSSAVVTLTHDPKLDDPALVAALRSDSFYVGALGSRRTHAKRIDRLKESGLDDAAILRIHSPIGLPLGGRNAPEIAVSILAEIIGSCYGADVSRKN